jgi:hypothetical protein
VDCPLVHFGEPWPTFKKLHQNTWKDVSISFPHSDVSTIGSASRTLSHRQFVEARSGKCEEKRKRLVFTVASNLKFCDISITEYAHVVWRSSSSAVHRLRHRSIFLSPIPTTLSVEESVVSSSPRRSTDFLDNCCTEMSTKFLNSVVPAHRQNGMSRFFELPVGIPRFPSGLPKTAKSDKMWAWSEPETNDLC